LQRSRTGRPLLRTAPVPVDPIVTLLRSWPANDSLQLSDLRAKTLALWMITLIMRPSDASSINADWITVSADGLSASVTLLGFKNDYQRDGATIELAAASDPLVCPIRAFLELRRRIYPDGVPQNAPLFTLLDGSLTRLKPASVSSICRDVCARAGLPEGAFSGRNFRPGGATRGMQSRVPLDVIMQIGRWRDASVVQRHYVSRARDSNVTDAILGTGARPSTASPLSTRTATSQATPLH